MTLGPRPPSRRETVEAASVEYPLALPAAKPLSLTFAVSGGGIFTVKAAPFEGGEFRTLYRTHAIGHQYGIAASVDLARFAGYQHSAALRGARFAGRSAVGGAGHRRRQRARRRRRFRRSAGQPKLLGKAGGCDSPALARIARRAGRPDGIGVRRAQALLPRLSRARGGRFAGGMALRHRTTGSARGAGGGPPSRAPPLPQLGGHVRRHERTAGGSAMPCARASGWKMRRRRSRGSSSTWKAYRPARGAKQRSASTPVRAM